MARDTLITADIQAKEELRYHFMAYIWYHVNNESHTITKWTLEVSLLWTNAYKTHCFILLLMQELDVL